MLLLALHINIYDKKIYFHVRKNQRKTQLIKPCTKGRVKKKTIEKRKIEQNDKKERTAKMCPHPLTKT